MAPPGAHGCANPLEEAVGRQPQGPLRHRDELDVRHRLELVLVAGEVIAHGRRSLNACGRQPEHGPRGERGPGHAARLGEGAVAALMSLDELRGRRERDRGGEDREAP